MSGTFSSRALLKGRFTRFIEKVPDTFVSSLFSVASVAEALSGDGVALSGLARGPVADQAADRVSGVRLFQANVRRVLRPCQPSLIRCPRTVPQEATASLAIAFGQPAGLMALPVVQNVEVEVAGGPEVVKIRRPADAVGVAADAHLASLLLRGVHVHHVTGILPGSARTVAARWSFLLSTPYTLRIVDAVQFFSGDFSSALSDSSRVEAAPPCSARGWHPCLSSYPSQRGATLNSPSGELGVYFEHAGRDRPIIGNIDRGYGDGRCGGPASGSARRKKVCPVRRSSCHNRPSREVRPPPPRRRRGSGRTALRAAARHRRGEGVRPRRWRHASGRRCRR